MTIADTELELGLLRPTFATGTLVQLLSGGPAMTVSSWARSDGLIMVQWFDGTKLMHEGFDPENLVPYLAEME